MLTINMFHSVPGVPRVKMEHPEHEAYDDEYRENTEINLATYYNDAIGVSKQPGQRDCGVVFLIDNDNAPYVITKPLRHTQKLLKEEKDGKLFSIN